MTDARDVIARELCEEDACEWDSLPDEGLPGMVGGKDDYRRLSALILRALSAAGLVVLPREPTEAMVRAGKFPTVSVPLGNGRMTQVPGLGANPGSIYRAMVKAYEDE